MKTGRIWTITLIAVIIALAVCLLPWPSRVNVTLPGVKASADGSVETDVTVRVEGWQLKYLFRQDHLTASVTVHDSVTNTDTSIKIDGPVFDTLVTEIWCSAPSYHAEINGFEIVNLSFTNTMDTFLLQRSSEESIYVAASDVRGNLPKILDRFSFILN